MASASGYNHHRFARAVLKKSRKWEPSLTVQLFPNHWRFENSPVNFPYDGPMKPFLLALRSQIIPTSLIPFLYDIHPPVSFVDGCLVVELQDHRRPGQPDVRSRVVMRPAAGALAQTIDVMLERRGQSWDEIMALELESRIIAATSPPLYLGTSPLASRNATLALSLTCPANPNLSADGTVRSTSNRTEGESKSSLDRMKRLLRAGVIDRSAAGTSSGPSGSGTAAAGGTSGGAASASATGTFSANWAVLRAKEKYEQLKAQKEQEAREAAARSMQAVNGGMPGGGPDDGTGAGPSQQNGADGMGGGAGTGEKKKGKKKRAAPQPEPAAEEEDEKEKPKPKKKKKVDKDKDKEKEKEKDKDDKEKEGTKKAKDKDKDKDKDEKEDKKEKKVKGETDSGKPGGGGKGEDKEAGTSTKKKKSQKNDTDKDKDQEKDKDKKDDKDKDTATVAPKKKVAKKKKDDAAAVGGGSKTKTEAATS
ncbi:hypothetical protein IAU59_006904 [Kwoniella sp. CBS 9459]